MRNTQLLGRLARCDGGLLGGKIAFDLALLGVLLLGDARRGDALFQFDAFLLGGLFLGNARLGHGAFLLDAGAFGGFDGGDLGLLDAAPALDFLRLGQLLVGDAGFVDQPLLGNARPLDVFAGRDLGGVHRLLALDFALPDLALGLDTRLGHLMFLGDALLFDAFARGDLGLFSLGFALGALASQFGALLGTAELHVAFLGETRFLALALDVEGLFFGFQVAATDADHRVLLDVVAQFPPGLDILDEAGKAFCIEAVGRIEIFQLGLVDILDGDRFELETVEIEAFLRHLAHPLDVDVALFVHLLHGHAGGDGAHRRDELAGEQFVQTVGLQRAPAQGGGGNRHRRFRRPDAYVELGLHVDAHAVLGDQCVVLLAHHLQRQRVHVDGRDVVDDRPHKGATVDDNLLTAQAGAHERHLLGGAAVEPVHDPIDDGDDDNRQNEPENELAYQLSGHDLPPLIAARERPITPCKP